MCIKNPHVAMGREEGVTGCGGVKNFSLLALVLSEFLINFWVRDGVYRDRGADFPRVRWLWGKTGARKMEIYFSEGRRTNSTSGLTDGEKIWNLFYQIPATEMTKEISKLS